MALTFSRQSGPRERQLQRKYNNPLFGESGLQISQQDIDVAHEQDEVSLNRFLQHFQELVQKAVDLDPNAESQTILDIKEKLDQCYTQCSALPGDQTQIRNAVDKLIQVIMQAIRQGAANDPVALNKLDEEDRARQTHKELHNHTIVADLLLPDSPIDEQDLLPTLLNEQQPALLAALQLFEPEQIGILYESGKNLVAKLNSEGYDMSAPRKNLDAFEKVLLASSNSIPN